MMKEFMIPGGVEPQKAKMYITEKSLKANAKMLLNIQAIKKKIRSRSYAVCCLAGYVYDVRSLP